MMLMRDHQAEFRVYGNIILSVVANGRVLLISINVVDVMDAVLKTIRTPTIYPSHKH